MINNKRVCWCILIALGVSLLTAPVAADKLEEALGFVLEQKGPITKTLETMSEINKAVDTFRNNPTVQRVGNSWLVKTIGSVLGVQKAPGQPTAAPSRSGTGNSASSSSRPGTSSGVIPAGSGGGGPAGPGGSGGSGSGGSAVPGGPAGTGADEFTYPPPSQGTVGGDCFVDEDGRGWCAPFGGQCINGKCVDCGSHGEPICRDYPPHCVSGCEEVNQYCVDTDAECGHVGTVECDGEVPCYYGVPKGGICIECGLYYQPCCQDTRYPCDYGECRNGICVPQGSAASASSSPSAAPSTAVRWYSYQGQTTQSDGTTFTVNIRYDLESSSYQGTPAVRYKTDHSMFAGSIGAHEICDYYTDSNGVLLAGTCTATGLDPTTGAQRTVQQAMTTINTPDPNLFPRQAGFSLSGTETVTVPLGTFRNAAKYTGTFGEIQLAYWLAPDNPVVLKLEMTSSKYPGSTVLMLKSWG